MRGVVVVILVAACAVASAAAAAADIHHPDLEVPDAGCPCITDITSYLNRTAPEVVNQTVTDGQCAGFSLPSYDGGVCLNETTRYTYGQNCAAHDRELWSACRVMPVKSRPAWCRSSW